MAYFKVELKVNGRDLIFPRIQADTLQEAFSKAIEKLAVLSVDVREDDVTLVLSTEL